VDTLLAGTPPLDAVRRSVYRIRAAIELGQDDALGDRWRDLFRALRFGDASEVLYAAQYAERCGWREAAARGYRQLTRMPAAASDGYAGLIRLAETSGSTQELGDVVREWVESSPGSIEGRNDLDYLNLLLGEKGSVEGSRRRFDEHPALLACRTTLALACLRNGEPHAAGKLYEDAGIDWSTAQPGWQAVFAATLAACGESERARAVARGIDSAHLKPEERALIAPLL
jgi:hypothetical protein